MAAVRWSWAAALLAAGLAGFSPAATRAQDPSIIRSPVLVLESERLYRESDFGRRVADEIAEQNAELAAENRGIEADLEAEEMELTERRPTLGPEEFRDLADAFDQKVQDTRREQEAKARTIARQQEEMRSDFLSAAAPVLEDVMREAGAAVILERRSVFLSLNAVDITNDVITRINEEIGDGGEPETEEPPQE